jgi:hypothetical protein
MNVVITLTSAGTDTSIFDLYSDVDNFVNPFETGISKANLLSGYESNLVPDLATIIKIKSLGICNNFIDVLIQEPDPIIEFQCFVLSSFEAPPGQTTIGGTNFSYTASDVNGLDIIQFIFVENNSVVSVCAKNVLIISGDAGSISISATKCCL